MSQGISPEDLGEPSLKVAGFQLWIHGWQLPDSDDYDDGNWLRVTAHCRASGASVWAQGAILQAVDIADFARQCESILSGRGHSATLDPIEPELRVSLEGIGRIGHIHAQVELTPDHLAQEHRMVFEIDQSYLPGIISQCSEILREYPIRGA